MTTDEFTETYSDDILYLQEGREALLTHPLRKEYSPLLNASFCRLYAIMMIGSIESMLERWQAKDKLKILEIYFAKKSKLDPKNSPSNKERIDNLRMAFVNNGINITNDVFDDYLAIKYLRNVIVHAGLLKQNEIEWIEERNFPTDTRNLNEEHWQKIQWVDQNMMLYIACTSIVQIKQNEIPIRPLSDTIGIIKSKDWLRLYKSNIERLSSFIRKQIEAAVLIHGQHLNLDLTKQPFQEMQHEEYERRFFMSVKRNYDCFDSLKLLNEHAENLVFCWNEYTRLVPEFSELSPEVVKNVIEIFRIIHDNKIFPKNGMLSELKDNAPEDIRHLKRSFENIEPLSIDQIDLACQIGKKAYGIIPNITPLRVFSIQLPIIAPNRAQEWMDTASYIADIFEIGRSWHSFRGNKSFSPDTISYYRDISKVLSVETTSLNNSPLL